MDDFNITIDNKEIDGESLSFDIKGNQETGLHKSIINSLRRTLLSSIPTISFRTDIDDSDITIVINTTSLHNEFLLHRIALLPIYLNPEEFKKQYLFYLKVESDNTIPLKTITAKDFMIYPLKENIDSKEVKLEFYDLTSPLNEKQKEEIFKPFVFKNEKEYCIITELKSTNTEETKQQLELYGSPSISYSYENSRWCAVSCATYSFKKDNNLFKKVLKEKIAVNNIPEEKQSSYEKELYISESERYFFRDNYIEPNYYEFKIDSVHFMNPKELFIQSNEIMIQQIQILKDEFPKISSGEKSILELKSTKENVYEIIVNGFDDTIGNIFQSFISRYMVNDESIFSMCGYKKTHPLEEIIIIYLTLNVNNKISKSNTTQKIFHIIKELQETCDHLINLYALIKKESEKEL